jgi:hypothetical protein
LVLALVDDLGILIDHEFLFLAILRRDCDFRFLARRRCKDSSRQVGQQVSKMTTMRTTGKKRAIRNAFFRLGLHAMPKAVVDALAQQGVLVEQELVRQVKFELVKETTGARVAKASRAVTSPGVRRRPKGFPGRRGNG